MYQDIRITLKVKRAQSEDMYDDFASLGPRFRAFRLRSIALDYYKAKASAPTPVSALNDQPAAEDTSADAAIIQAFGKTLGIGSTS